MAASVSSLPIVLVVAFRAAVPKVREQLKALESDEDWEGPPSISRAEFAVLMRLQGLSSRQSNAIFATIDKNGDGWVTFEELDAATGFRRRGVVSRRGGNTVASPLWLEPRQSPPASAAGSQTRMQSPRASDPSPLGGSSAPAAAAVESSATESSESSDSSEGEAGSGRAATLRPLNPNAKAWTGEGEEMQSYTIGETCFMLNPYFGDGTRLRVGPDREAEFCGNVLIANGTVCFVYSTHAAAAGVKTAG